MHAVVIWMSVVHVVHVGLVLLWVVDSCHCVCALHGRIIVVGLAHYIDNLIISCCEGVLTLILSGLRIVQ